MQLLNVEIHQLEVKQLNFFRIFRLQMGVVIFGREMLFRT